LQKWQVVVGATSLSYMPITNAIFIIHQSQLLGKLISQDLFPYKKHFLL